MSPARLRRHGRIKRVANVLNAVESMGKREWLRHAIGIKLAVAIGLLVSSHPAIAEYSWLIGLATNQLWLWKT